MGVVPLSAIMGAASATGKLTQEQKDELEKSILDDKVPVMMSIAQASLLMRASRAFSLSMLTDGVKEIPEVSVKHGKDAAGEAAAFVLHSVKILDEMTDTLRAICEERMLRAAELFGLDKPGTNTPADSE